MRSWLLAGAPIAWSRPHAFPWSRSARTLRARDASRRFRLVKDALLALLAPHCREDLEEGSHVADFSGIVLSGRMQKTTPGLIADMEARAAEQGRDLEVLFHPISVPIEQCLDPENLPFAQACASPNRDAEAKLIASLSTRA